MKFSELPMGCLFNYVNEFGVVASEVLVKDGPKRYLIGPNGKTGSGTLGDSDFDVQIIPSMTAQHYEGKLVAQETDLRCENNARLGECYQGSDFQHCEAAQNASELARRWNAHDAHVATIEELGEALALILKDGNCFCAEISDSKTQCDFCKASATLAKSQAKGSL